MTTPANPTPEPTPLTDKAAEIGIGPRSLLGGNAVTADFARDLERQLSDTRRRLAEVEKGAKTAGEIAIQAVKEMELANEGRRQARNQLTALRNAADGMRVAIEQLQIRFYSPPDSNATAAAITAGRNAITAYAALISEGAG